MKRASRLRGGSIAVIGNYLPRQCGIATFTTDLCEALGAAYPETPNYVVALNDTADGYPYPARVKHTLAQHDFAAYGRAADWLNAKAPAVVVVQHEYGIFGGAAGDYLLELLCSVQMPVVTTLHTVLAEPNSDQRRVLHALGALSARLVVMSRYGAHLLQTIYNVPGHKIDIIPHGIPDFPSSDSAVHKTLFGVDGKLVMLTFGLLSPNKGIEYVIRAMPRILERVPDIVYMVLGETHPHIRRSEAGESYRSFLQELARSEGVEGNVIFYDRFVDIDQLIRFLSAADIYITPYLNREQIVSGTLSYSVGAGKVVISTPYLYAEELLAHGCGLLIPFGDSEAIATQVLSVLENPGQAQALRSRAYSLGREMTWDKVAHRYMDSLEQAIQAYRHSTTRSPTVWMQQAGYGRQVAPVVSVHESISPAA